LLHGVIDSPDIPLNVSRSYLQSDSNVKKISNHITKKVADKLEELFKKDRPQYEQKWDSLKLFVQYGMLTEDKFYEKAVNFCLVKNIDDKYFTLDEYKTLIEGAQTDKNGTLVYLYANSKDDQYAHIDAAKSKGYDVLIMDGQLDIHWMGMIEQKFGKTRFVRVDSDTIDHLIQKEEVANVELTDKQKENMTEAVKSLLPTVTKAEFDVDFKALSENDKPVQITQNEFSRRMKEMSAMQPGMAFYGEMPDMFQVVLNVNHPLIKQVINEVENREKDDMKAYASENKKLKQMIDLALLSNGMLKGEALSDFIKRSIDLM